MAKLWEDSVVTAIRDEKWLHALRNGAPRYGDFPLPQMNMSGKAEQKLGDLLDVTDDLFFLFEVKAERKDIEHEWHTKNARDDHKKKAFLSLHDCVYSKNPPTYAKELIDLSIRGHFLAYWSEEHRIDPKSQKKIGQGELGDQAPPHEMKWSDLVEVLNQVVVTPYLLGCLDHWHEDDASPLTTTYRSCIRPGFVNPLTGKCFIRDHVPLSILYGGDGRTFEIDLSLPEKTVHGESIWGLTLDEMKKYIELLCRRFGVKPEAIHAVVMSRSGRFFRVLTRTDQLSNMVSPTPTSDPATNLRIESCMSRMDAKKKLALQVELKKKVERERHLRRRNHGPTSS